MSRHEVLPAIVRALADVDDCSPHDLGYSLYDYVDTTAVRSFWASEQTSWELTFDVPDHTVVIRGTGDERVDDELVRTVPQPVHE
jgi:hypothetical protein